MPVLPVKSTGGSGGKKFSKREIQIANNNHDQGFRCQCSGLGWVEVPVFKVSGVSVQVSGWRFLTPETHWDLSFVI
jgi:hypothetical protein